MNIQEVIKQQKKKIDIEIEAHFEHFILDAQAKDRTIAQALKNVKKLILSGGKRLRPILMIQGYQAAGGKDEKMVLATSPSIELIHMFLLIHDDIMDRDSIRHGQATVNSHYEKWGRMMFGRKDSVHFGNSMAIIIGDMVGALGSQIIFSSKFPAERITRALNKLQSIISLTVIGQTKDIYMEYLGKASEKEVLKMYEYKTARYTIEGPLHLGAILAGADDQLLAGLSRYAIPLGIAFQIQDDIIGIFGSEKKIGKPVGSDIREGKITLLYLYAWKKADAWQKKDIRRIFGKKNLTGRDISDFRRIIKETGALDYANEKADKMIKKSQEALGTIDIAPESKEFLVELNEYLGRREI
jgi:geranylgeranyl diphosphate synthase, type I